MTQAYELCLCDAKTILTHQLQTPEFRTSDQVNRVPYQQFGDKQQRIFSNFMSGDWAWQQAVCNIFHIHSLLLTLFRQDIIAEDECTHGAMFVPIISGSYKATCSVATGHQEYRPVYISPGNLTNTARRAHGNLVLPVVFLPIPKSK